ncbi:MAG: hypothetical protein KDA68_01780 [Planctomycetaceae bacterium]|nr:hypothetical protein [Planctomycetaceae bacterium]
MNPNSHWTPRYWLAFPILLVSLAWFFAYADDPTLEKEFSDFQPALESSAEQQETVTDTSTAPDKKEIKEQPAQPTDPNLNKSSTETTFPGNAVGGGFGGGGYGGGGGGFGGGGQTSAHNYLMSSNGALTWNKGKTVFWGYSNSLGKWTAVRPPKDSGPAHPLTNKNVIALQLKDRVYGFSATVGRWQELQADKPAPVIQEDQILVVDGDKIHIFSEKTGRWTSPGEDDVKLMGVQKLMGEQFYNFPSLIGQTAPQAPPVTTSTSPAPVTIPGPSVLYATQSGLTQQQAHVAATAVLTQPQNLWRRRADLYQQSAKELLVAVQRIDQQSPDASETRDRMKKEYDELLKLTVDARLNAQKEDAQLLKTRLEKIEAQIAENEKKKPEMIQQLDEQFKTAPTPRRPMLESNSESSSLDRRVNPSSRSTARPTEFIP